MLRILTYNVHGCVGGDGDYDVLRVAAVIRRSQCDIACLQEVEVNGEPRRLRSWSNKHADSQPELLAKATGLVSISFAGPLCAYTGEYARTMCEDPFDEVLIRDKECTSGFGNAVLSKFDIIETRSLVFAQDNPPLSEDYIYMDREAQPRGARAVLVDLNAASTAGDADGKADGKEAELAGERERRCCAGPEKAKEEEEEEEEEEAPKKKRALLWVVCTQLSHTVSRAEQRDQAEQLLSWVDNIISDHTGDDKIGVVICGDMNAAPFMPCSSYSALSGGNGWQDVWKSRGTWCKQSTYPSCCGPLCGVRLDHVFVVQRADLAEVECTSARVFADQRQDTQAAAHSAVLVEIKVGGMEPQKEKE